MTELERKTKRGNIGWCDTSVLGIIKNEKYKGDVLQGKTFTLDPISKRRLDNRGEEDQYYIKNHHETIVSEEAFEKAQDILHRRGEMEAGGKREKYSRKFAFSSMMECAFCGGHFSRRSWNSGTTHEKTIWQCSTNTKKGKKYCPHSKGIEEKIVEGAFVETYNLVCDNHIPASELSKREATIESLVRKRIYRIHPNYKEVGVTAIELITTQLPSIVTYEETPTPKEKNLIVLGRDVKGNVYWDFIDQPHLLVVGIPKSGKSVSVNNIIRQMKEKSVLMLFVDFKNGLEYAPYASKGYNVIEDADHYPDFSAKLVNEMSNRAEFLKKHGFKNFEGYEAVREQRSLPLLPRIVCFIDEVATVMGHSDPAIQKPSVQNTELLLQKARASGIHMVLSTQRPDARSLGNTGIRDNIAVKMSSYLSAQASTLIYGDDRANQRIPDQGYAGIFIASGLGTD